MTDVADSSIEQPVREAHAEDTLARVVSLAAAVHAGFSPKFRHRITVDRIAEILGAFDLNDARPTRTTPLLRLRRLHFMGEKFLRETDVPRPIDYDQRFAPGVNVVLIEDNDVGKSSIMKTIKFALTGDDGDYDLDVKGWIKDIWLTFALDAQEFTVAVSTRNGLRATMVLGEEIQPVEEAVASPALLWEATGAETIRSELQRFFFRRLGVNELSWTAQASPTAPVTTPSTTWLTYFQALQILDDRYLLCDLAHSYGHQEGLILSAFLGLRLAEPLNRLGVEIQRTRKEQRAEQARTAEEAACVEEQIARHEARITELRTAMAAIDMAQRQRREAIQDSLPATRLVEVQTALVARSIERSRLLQEREDLAQRIRQARAEARRLREAQKLHLHFTGLTVTVCPSCDAAVDEAAVRREEEEHLCRLCGRTPPSAPADKIATMEAQADAAETRAADMDRERAILSTRIRALDSEITALTEETTVLQEAAERGLDAALPSREEELERVRLAEEIGDLNAQIRLARLRSKARAPDEEAAEMRTRVLEKARDLLKDEAQALNMTLLTRLSALTQDVVQRIGVDSIGDVTILPLGDLQFSKNGVRVRFGSLQNQGDRLRVKLAFFLAMMRLGRDPGLGRHPGLLLIDQPGGAEMVAQDFAELAEVFRGIDRGLADDTQIICFTARPEFAAATDPCKVYGPQGADGTAF